MQDVFDGEDKVKSSETHQADLASDKDLAEAFKGYSVGEEFTAFYEFDKDDLEMKHPKSYSCITFTSITKKDGETIDLDTLVKEQKDVWKEAYGEEIADYKSLVTRCEKDLTDAYGNVSRSLSASNFILPDITEEMRGFYKLYQETVSGGLPEDAEISDEDAKAGISMMAVYQYLAEKAGFSEMQEETITTPETIAGAEKLQKFYKMQEFGTQIFQSGEF